MELNIDDKTEILSQSQVMFSLIWGHEAAAVFMHFAELPLWRGTNEWITRERPMHTGKDITEYVLFVCDR